MTKTTTATESGRLFDANLEKIMSRPPITVSTDVTLAEAARRMLDAKVGSLLVVNDAGELIGIITESDFCARRAGIPFSTLHRPQVLGEWLGDEGVERVYREARRRTVAEAMSPHVQAVAPSDSVERVLRLMMERDIKHVPIVEDDRAIGVVARHDLLKMVLDSLANGDATDEG